MATFQIATAGTQKLSPELMGYPSKLRLPLYNNRVSVMRIRRILLDEHNACRLSQTTGKMSAKLICQQMSMTEKLIRKRAIIYIYPNTRTRLCGRVSICVYRVRIQPTARQAYDAGIDFQC